MSNASANTERIKQLRELADHLEQIEQLREFPLSVRMTMVSDLDTRDEENLRYAKTLERELEYRSVRNEALVKKRENLLRMFNGLRKKFKCVKNSLHAVQKECNEAKRLSRAYLGVANLVPELHAVNAKLCAENELLSQHACEPAEIKINLIPTQETQFCGGCQMLTKEIEELRAQHEAAMNKLQEDLEDEMTSKAVLLPVLGEVGERKVQLKCSLNPDTCRGAHPVGGPCTHIDNEVDGSGSGMDFSPPEATLKRQKELDEYLKKAGPVEVTAAARKQVNEILTVSEPPAEEPKPKYGKICNQCKLEKPGRWIDGITGICSTCRDKRPVAVVSRSVDYKIKPYLEAYDQLWKIYRDGLTFSVYDVHSRLSLTDVEDARSLMANLVAKNLAHAVPGRGQRWRLKQESPPDAIESAKAAWGV